MGSGTAGSPPNCIVGGGGEGLPPPETVIEVPPNPNPFHLSVIPLFGALGGGTALCGMRGIADVSPHRSLEPRPPPSPAPGRGKQRFGVCGWVGRGSGGRWGSLHGVALPVTLQLQLLSFPWVLRVRFDLRCWFVWRGSGGVRALPHSPPAGTPNPAPSPPPPAPPRHGCDVRASTGEQLPHPPSCPRGGMGGDGDNRGRGCWGQGGPRGQGWAGEVTLCSIPTWDSASGLHRCTHRTTCGDYEVPQTSPTSLWPHPLPQVASSPPVPSCHVQWTCSFCVVDLSEFCKDSWSTVQVTSASLSSLVTRNSTRLLTVKVFPLESSTTSVPSAAGTGGGWR